MKYPGSYAYVCEVKVGLFYKVRQADVLVDNGRCSRCQSGVRTFC